MIKLMPAALIATPAVSQNWRWRTIAFKTVKGCIDNDRINVRGNERFREERLCAFNAPISMRDCDIRFENNQRQDVRVRQTIRAGSCTRNIDLNGNRRDIDTIRLRYEPIYRGITQPIVRVQVR